MDKTKTRAESLADELQQLTLQHHHDIHGFPNPGHVAAPKRSAGNSIMAMFTKKRSQDEIEHKLEQTKYDYARHRQVYGQLRQDFFVNTLPGLLKVGYARMLCICTNPSAIKRSQR